MPIRSLLRSTVLLTGVLIGIISSAAITHVTAAADPPVKFTYPWQGWAAQAHTEGHNGYGTFNHPTWWGGAEKDDGEDSCSDGRHAVLQSAVSIAISTTTGKPETPDWPGGLVLSGVGCSVSAESRTLITTFVTATGGNSPGFTYLDQADADQCSSQGLSFPCGSWSTTTQIQIAAWNAKNSMQKKLLLLHEWAHAFNLPDYCGSSTAMTRPGTSGCSFPSTPAYYPKDRSALFIAFGN